MDSFLSKLLCWLAFIYFSDAEQLEYNPCGDWIAYKDEKCIKFVGGPGLQTKDDAEIICKEIGEKIDSIEVPKLATIKTEQKQKFLQKILFDDLEIFDNIWLGLDLGNDSIYRWNDGSNLYYMNWAEEAYAIHDKSCVQMESGDGVYEVGKWAKASCKKRNAVVCEKTQPWNVVMVQNTVLNMKLELEKNRKEIESLKSNPVPLGFVYIQLPEKEAPTTLWPQTKWKNVTSEYAGLFFRVEGGAAASFGELQEENKPSLAAVNYQNLPNSDWVNEALIPSDGQWSQFVYSGGWSATYNYGTRYRMNPGEVRPRNKAVKVWQRIE